MKEKRLLTVQLHVRKNEELDEKILAFVDIIDKRKDAEVFHLSITSNEDPFYNETIVSSSFELVKIKIVDELRKRIDLFNPAVTSIEIVEDSHSILKKLTLCCPKCGRKLLESWGKVKGIATKCHRCYTICIPTIR